MKTAYLSIRVTPDQKKQIMELAQGKLSAYAIKRLLPFQAIGLGEKPSNYIDKPAGNKNPPYKSPWTDSMKEVDEVETISSAFKCCSCPSFDTLPYDRNGKTFYLCNSHKP